jgi:hypothetical protein
VVAVLESHAAAAKITATAQDSAAAKRLALRLCLNIAKPFRIDE